jgi:hypothetical protein
MDYYKEEREKRQHKEEMIKVKWSLIFIAIFLGVAVVGWFITEII